MKTAYELALERLNKAEPAVKVTEEQKRRLAELDSLYAAKIAERELLVQGQIASAMEEGDSLALEQLQKQLVSDRKSLHFERDEKKEAVRQGK